MKNSLVLDAGSAEALPAILSNLRRFRFTAIQSFDLRSALAAHPGCACPFHNTELCTCQYSVLLVYPLAQAAQASPLVLTAHSHDHETQVQLVEANFGTALSTNGEVTAAEGVMIALIETAYSLATRNQALVPTHAAT